MHCNINDLLAGVTLNTFPGSYQGWPQHRSLLIQRNGGRTAALLVWIKHQRSSARPETCQGQFPFYVSLTQCMLVNTPATETYECSQKNNVISKIHHSRLAPGRTESSMWDTALQLLYLSEPCLLYICRTVHINQPVLHKPTTRQVQVDLTTLP